MAVSHLIVVTVPSPKKFKTNTWSEPNQSMRRMLILLGLQWGLQGVPCDSPARIYRFVGCVKTLFWGCFCWWGQVEIQRVFLVMIVESFAHPRNRTYPGMTHKWCFYIVKMTFFNRLNRTKKTKSSTSHFRTPPHIYELPYMAPTRIQAREIGPGMVL